jgi:hypothetical protein
MEIRANIRWLRKRRNELLAALSVSCPGKLSRLDAESKLEPFWDRMELHFVEAALGLMATHEGKQDLKQAIQQLRGREVARKAMQVRDEPTPGKDRVMNARYRVSS